MANTADTTETNGGIQVMYSGTGADWNYATATPFYARSGYICRSITFHGSAINDVCIINEGGDDGASHVHWQLSAATDDRVKYFSPPKHIRPHIDLSDCDYTDPTVVKVTFDLV